ncbi:MAG: hypothetical protein PVF15_02850 [Candidatus Bathyarchaeota archaeon]|jgi:hypothetical protein
MPVPTISGPKQVKSLKEWREQNPKQGRDIAKILEICEKYRATSLEQIIYPELKIVVSSPAIKL